MAAMTIPGRIGVVLRDPLPWEQWVQVAETAEETGYRALFVPEIAGREAFASLAGLARATTRIALGTGVVPVGARTPVATAMAAATVHELSDGRMILGIGAGDVAGRRRYGAGLRSLELVERYVRLVKRILAGDDVEPDPVLGTPAFRLDLALGPGPPPLWLGALGDGMISLAGSVADGVILNWCTPGRVAEARALVDRSLDAAGRERSGFTLAVYVRASLGLSDDLALASLRPMTAQYASIPHYRRQLEAMGLGEEAALAAKGLQAGRGQDVPEGLVRALAILGGRDEAAARFDEFIRAGADLVLCYPVSALEPFSSILRTVLAAAPNPAVER
jgi:alkanesulfonate monooxygenase SsuD/methylene tetrahydromethanopterin reductase-like flavin-dependent oxidoreductase (luciferase family)